MSLFSRIEQPLTQVANSAFAVWPQRKPTPERLEATQIFSHRGERDNKRIKENTFAAFDPLVGSGVAGIEFDIRWTADFEPVVFHDLDAKRVWGKNLILEKTNLATLRSELPEVPTLAEMVQRYGGEFHLMIEFKKENYRDPERQIARLTEVLSPLDPGTNFTACSFDVDLLEALTCIPAGAKLLIAHTQVAPVSDAVLQLEYGGIGAHLMLMSQYMIERHKAAGTRVSVGFPESKNGLYREINRGVDWIFSNNALAMQAIVNAVRA